MSFAIIALNQILFILILIYAYSYFMKKRRINIYMNKKNGREKREVKLPPTAVKQVTPLPDLSKSLQQQFLEKELEELNKRLEKKRREQPYQAKMLKTEKAYQKKLAPIERKLAEISPEALAEAKQRELCGKLRPGYLVEWDINNDLAKIRCSMGKSELEPASFLGRVKKKFSSQQEQSIEELTTQMVKKISKKIEGKHPIPPNELIWVQQELKQLRQEISQQGI
ncbi:MAG: hypothetical protein KJ896_03420 [Nanoarchaeota archaeon]|nr:hypothetical protein [Nanoarchaeota archaeon]